MTMQTVNVNPADPARVARKALRRPAQQKQHAILTTPASRIRQLEARIVELSALLRQDPLTQSLNRRGLDDEFRREVARADRYHTPFCIAFIDIDDFKALNDRHGHQAGDKALIHLVKVMREELRVTDHIARIGGEEFLLLLPDTGLDQATRVLTRLQRSLATKCFLGNYERLAITFSAGVAEHFSGEAQHATIARADAAMYVAKHAGKNRVCTPPEFPCTVKIASA